MANRTAIEQGLEIGGASFSVGQTEHDHSPKIRAAMSITIQGGMMPGSGRNDTASRPNKDQKGSTDGANTPSHLRIFNS